MYRLTRHLAWLGLALTSLTIARPESAWRPQPAEDSSGARMAPAPPPPQVQPQSPPQVQPPSQSPSQSPAEPRQRPRPPTPAAGQAPVPGRVPVPHYAPSGPPPPVFGVARPGSPYAAPRGGVPGVPPTPRQPGAPGQPGGFSGTYPGGNGPGNGGGNWRADDRDHNGAHHDWTTDRGRNNYNPPSYDGFRSRNYRYDGGHYYARTRYRLGAFYWPYGYGSHVWLIGEWLPPPFFYEESYYLDNYWTYGLYQPPYGCRWMRVGDNALLVDQFSGEILDQVYDLFW